MANFMGPMAPPQAAPSQPPQLDIRTNPNQRQRFRNFMRQNTRPAGMTGVPPMYPAAQTPFPAAPMPPMAMPAPTPMMPMQMAQPMQPPMGPARNLDVFSPQYMQAQPPVGMEDGGAIPPRRTEIKGQDHMLAYITPDEAGILSALGGAGKPGPMGIPSYYDEGDDMESSGGDQTGDDVAEMSRDESDRDAGRERDAQTLANAQAALAASEAAQREREQAALARDIVANAAQSRPQVNLTVVEDPQQTQQELDVFGMSSQAPATTTDETPQIGAVKSSPSPTAMDTLNAINDMLGLNANLLADSKPMTDRQALAQSSPAVSPAESKAPASSKNVLGMDDEYDDVVGTPDYNNANRDGYKDGLPTGLEYQDTRRGRFTTNLAGLTEEQRAAMPSYMSPEGKTGIVAGLMNRVGIDPSQSAYGYEFNNAGDVVGMIGESQLPSIGPAGAIMDMIKNQFMSPPENTEDLLNSGVYTGYGQGSLPNDFVGAGGGGGSSNPIFYYPQNINPEVASDVTKLPNVLGGMDTTYTEPSSPLVPSTRQAGPMDFVLPVGYGSFDTGTIDPYAYLSAGFPVGAQFFADGGEVLDQAAGRFLEALTAA